MTTDAPHWLVLILVLGVLATWTLAPVAGHLAARREQAARRALAARVAAELPPAAPVRVTSTRVVQEIER